MTDTHIVNPNLDIVPIESNNVVTGFDVRTVVKGRGKLECILAANSKNAPAFHALNSLLTGQSEQLDSNAWAHLLGLGIVIKPGEVASPVRFACQLDEMSEADMPGRLIPREPEVLRVNPTLRITSFDELVSIDRRNAHIWEPTTHVIMVRDPRTHIVYPYWASEELRAKIEQMKPGELAPTMFGADERRRLFLAGILVDDDSEQFDTFVAAARARYAANGYVVLPHLLCAPHIVSMRRYYARVIEEGFVHFSDGQVPLRFAEHSEPLMVYYHAQLRGLFEAIAGEPLKCSYPYFGAYRTGAVLEKHTDREQCEFTASLLIEQTPRPDDLSDWPLYLEVPATGEQVAMLMGIGDGSLYKGRELPHYRLPFEGTLMTCHFYHYVKADFCGRLG